MNFTIVALPTKNIGVQFPNLGAIALAQTARDLGHEVNLIDAVRYGYSQEEVAREIAKNKPDLIGLSGLIVSYYYFEPLVDILKKRFPKTPVIVGGGITSAIELIEKYTKVDFLVKGEGEDCLTELLARLSSGRRLNLGDIPGLFVRDEDRFKSPAMEHSYPDLSNIPIPAYDLYDMKHYTDSCTNNVYRSLMFYPKIHEEVGSGVKFFPAVITRGCPFSCFFCHRLIKKHRHPPIDNVIKHLRLIKEKYGCSGITLLDELIIVDRKWFIELCDSVSGELPGFKIFSGAGRVDLITPEILAHSKKAGFIRFGCGIESGSQTILDNLDKKTTVRQNVEAIRLIKGTGMMATCNMLFGAPGESKKTLRETEKFIKENLDPRDYAVNLAYAYPGAPLFDYAVDKGILKRESIHDYVLNADFGDYPLNFSDFDNGERLCREVELMQFRLKVGFMWKNKEYKHLLNFVIKSFMLESIYIISPRLLQALRSFNQKRRLFMVKYGFFVKK